MQFIMSHKIPALHEPYQKPWSFQWYWEMSLSVPFFGCCSFKNNFGLPSFQEGQHRGTKRKKACSRILESALTDSTFVYWLLCRKVLFLSSVHLLFYLKTLQSCRITMKPEQDSSPLSVFHGMNSHSDAFTTLPILESLSWLLWQPGSGSHDTNCTPSLNQDAYKH